jgi:hypothetical protein
VETRTAQCHCGRLQLACEGAPHKISMCHCDDCQRRTGSAFSIAVFYERERVRVQGAAPKSFERPSASGFCVLFHFCGDCGANVFWEARRMPHLIAVAAGAFADPNFPAPAQSVWTKDKHAWLELPDTIAQFALAPVQPAAK